MVSGHCTDGVLQILGNCVAFIEKGSYNERLGTAPPVDLGYERPW